MVLLLQMKKVIALQMPTDTCKGIAIAPEMVTAQAAKPNTRAWAGTARSPYADTSAGNGVNLGQPVIIEVGL